jgi:hypothetical protein
MMLTGRKGKIKLTSVTLCTRLSNHPPYHTPTPAMVTVASDVPSAASSPNASATGMPHNSATSRSRRSWSVPASPYTCP